MDVALLYQGSTNAFMLSLFLPFPRPTGRSSISMTDHPFLDEPPVKKRPSPNTIRPSTTMGASQSTLQGHWNQDSDVVARDATISNDHSALEQQSSEAAIKSTTKGTDDSDKDSDDSSYGGNISDRELVARLAASALERVTATIRQADLREREQAQADKSPEASSHVVQEKTFLESDKQETAEDSESQVLEIGFVKPTQDQNQDLDHEARKIDSIQVDLTTTGTTCLTTGRQESALYPDLTDNQNRKDGTTALQGVQATSEDATANPEKLDRSIPFDDPGLSHVRDVFFCFAFMHRFFELLKKSCSTIPVKMYSFEVK